ncbi:MAG: D-alanine--D-alanine ligase [Deltaproteobacteria bacterium]
MEIKRKYGRIGVLMGGPSSEREISLKSGRGVLEALKGLGLDAVSVDVTTADRQQNLALLRSSGIQCAFIALHGCFGEDGQVQRLLEELRIPYTGSSPDAHRIALDKSLAREAFILAGIRVPDCVVVRKGEAHIKDRAMALGLPLVIKPATQGSSIGLSIIDSIGALDRALTEAFTYDGVVLVEQYIKGRELTVGVLKGAPLPVIEIVPKNRYFDFEAKYSHGMTEYVIPARISDEAARRAQLAALNAHRCLGCAGCSRTDIIMDAEGGLFVLEINTIPGLTATSLVPKAARTAGIEFPALCLELLESAYEKK